MRNTKIIAVVATLFVFGGCQQDVSSPTQATPPVTTAAAPAQATTPATTVPAAPTTAVAGACDLESLKEHAKLVGFPDVQDPNRVFGETATVQAKASDVWGPECPPLFLTSCAVADDGTQTKYKTSDPVQLGTGPSTLSVKMPSCTRAQTDLHKGKAPTNCDFRGTGDFVKGWYGRTEGCVSPPVPTPPAPSPTPSATPTPPPSPSPSPTPTPSPSPTPTPSPSPTPTPSPSPSPTTPPCPEIHLRAVFKDGVPNPVTDPTSVTAKASVTPSWDNVPGAPSRVTVNFIGYGTRTAENGEKISWDFTMRTEAFTVHVEITGPCSKVVGELHIPALPPCVTCAQIHLGMGGQVQANVLVLQVTVGAPSSRPIEVTAVPATGATITGSVGVNGGVVRLTGTSPARDYTVTVVAYDSNGNRCETHNLFHF